jgi:hypothetical protein
MRGYLKNIFPNWILKQMHVFLLFSFDSVALPSKLSILSQSPIFWTKKSTFSLKLVWS